MTEQIDGQPIDQSSTELKSDLGKIQPTTESSAQPKPIHKRRRLRRWVWFGLATIPLAVLTVGAIDYFDEYRDSASEPKYTPELASNAAYAGKAAIPVQWQGESQSEAAKFGFQNPQPQLPDPRNRIADTARQFANQQQPKVQASVGVYQPYPTPDFSPNTQYAQRNPNLYPGINNALQSSSRIGVPIQPSQRTQAEALARQIKSLPEEKREAAAQQLYEFLKKEFEKRHGKQVAALVELEKQIERTREALEWRQKSANEIVHRRYLQLLGARDPLSWDYDYDLDPGAAAGLQDLRRSVPNSGRQALPSTTPAFASPAPAALGSLPPSASNELQPQAFESVGDTIGDTTQIASATAPNLPPQLQSGATHFPQLLPTAPPAANGNSVVNATSSGSQFDELVDLASQIKILALEMSRLKKLSARHMVSPQEYETKALQLDAARTRWEFKKQALEDQLRAARAQEKALYSKIQALKGEAERLEAIAAIEKVGSEVRQLKRILEWYSSAIKEKETSQNGAQPPGLSSTSEEASIESIKPAEAAESSEAEGSFFQSDNSTEAEEAASAAAEDLGAIRTNQAVPIAGSETELSNESFLGRVETEASELEEESAALEQLP
ncbi:MAG: hypothetical protein AB8B50_14220 [Pirellulaceae bacterium]